MPDNVQECKRRLLKIAGDTPEHRAIVDRNIVCHDALTYDFSFGKGEQPKPFTIDDLLIW
jgi:hypothetical protein